MAKYKLPVDKQSVANELKVNLGPDSTSRQNGSVGGSMVKKTFEYVNGKVTKS
ncbi:MAG: Small, acid-soluble spore protein C [Candidatus Dichloromethanomonas elyunquensis]|nr:MAG: Small, acid-soluble spore protein C [Candidatus Dichloromethanomonas elyunquensis]